MLTFLRLDLYVMVLHHPTTTSLDNIAFSEILPRATCLGDDVSGINYMIAQANQQIRRFCRITTCPYIAHPACNAMKHGQKIQLVTTPSCSSVIDNADHIRR